jgi:mannose-6-phosphate isomerase
MFRPRSSQPLHCVAQDYAWGRLGSSSTVARMKEAQAKLEGDDSFEIDESATYAELWLGTHPSGMSRVTVNNDDPASMSLLDYVRQDTDLHCGTGTTDLSFLLKILSVRTVLSIQAHPDKALAERLHAERPHVYKDPNHKPEMAISLSERCRAMCGFRPVSEIAAHVVEYPEFRAVLGEELAQRVESATPGESKDVLRDMFAAYLTADKNFVQDCIVTMIERLKKMTHLNEVQRLVLQVAEQFPDDTGIFSPLILNLVELKQGEALFIDANEPHAYISGEMIECMACSDNVVRAGLTPKLVDVPTLVDMLTYKPGMPETTCGTKVDRFCTRYQPPVSDFCVESVWIPAGESYTLSTVASPSVLLTLDGEATLDQSGTLMSVSFGSAAFLSTNTTCKVAAGPYGVQLTRAFSNVFHK